MRGAIAWWPCIRRAVERKFSASYCYSRLRYNLPGIAKNKLNWRRPLFFALLPIFFIMVFLGFPLPVGTPPTKQGQERSAPARNKKNQWLDILQAGDGADTDQRDGREA